MSNQTILWTCLPGGITSGGAGQYQMSILVTPRLSGGGTLGAYEAWAVWPATLQRLLENGLNGVLSVGTPPQTIPLTIKSSSAMINPAYSETAAQLWQMIFPANTPVQDTNVGHVNGMDYTQSATNSVILTHHVANNYANIKGLYQQTAVQSSGGPPTADTLNNTYGLANIVPPPIMSGEQPAIQKSRVVPHTVSASTSLGFALPTGQAFENLLATVLGSVNASGNTQTPVTTIPSLPILTSNVSQKGVARVFESVRQTPVVTIPPVTGSTAPPAAINLSTQAHYDTFRLMLFHQARTTQVPDPSFPNVQGVPTVTQPASLPEPAALANVLDFHQQVAALAKYPILMRQLGLIVDVIVTLPPQAAFPTGTGLTNQPLLISLSTPSAGLGFTDMTDMTPPTALTDDGSFIALPNPNLTIDSRLHIHNGYYQIDLSQTPTKEIDPTTSITTPVPSPYSLVDMDVHSATFKLVSLATNIAQAGANSTTDTPQTASLHSLRSAGLSLNYTQRDQALSLALGRTAQLSAGAPLYAEDLIRGYRIDVSDDQDSQWRSLMQRVGTYTLGGLPIVASGSGVVVPGFNPVDEGIVQMAVTQPSSPSSVASGDTPPPPILYLHESMLRWRGWSLAAPSPFNPGVQTPGAEVVVPGVNLTVQFTPLPGSLPRLRFGRRYAMQMRAVDLAGNSLPPGPPNTTDPALATGVPSQSPRYGRFEPAAAPLVVLRNAPGISESSLNVVIRSYNSAPALDTTATAEISERHLVPPKVSVETAEVHGMFDAADGSNGFAGGAYALLTQYADGSFQTLTTANPGASGTAATTNYSIDPAAQAAVPYLPDPLSAGAALGVLVNTSPAGGTQTPSYLPLVSFPGAWPNVAPFRVLFQEDPIVTHTSPTHVFDSTQRVLTLAAPKGRFFRIALSSYLPAVAPGGALGSSPPIALELMGLWQWLNDGGIPGVGEGTLSESQLLSLQTQTEAGQHWMFTPPVTLTFIHAVQQPLGVPNLTTLVPFKNLGDTFVTFAAALVCDVLSTGRIDIQALWSDPYDNPADPSSTHPDQQRVTGQNHAVQMPLPLDLNTKQNVPNQMALPLNTTLTVPPALSFQADDGTSATFTPADQTLAFNLPVVPNTPAPATPRQEFGDTKHRVVSYTPIATTRFREYFPADTAGVPPNVPPNLNFTRQQAIPTVRHILNSARPDAPRVVSVLPTFRTAGSGTPESPKTRQGGLRVYLDRPWHSSGDGELLGVVLWDAPLESFMEIPLLGRVKMSKKMHKKPTSKPERLPTPKRSPKIFAGHGRRHPLFAVSTADVPLGMIPYVTQWGADPVWAENTLPASSQGIPPNAPATLPDLTDFLNTADTSDAVANAGFSPTSLTLEELVVVSSDGAPVDGPPVSVAAFAVAFDASRNLWFADIDIDPQTYYFPFIRLALARCQPYSVPDAHLSRVVLADYAQLTPERSVSLVSSGSQLIVTVSGITTVTNDQPLDDGTRHGVPVVSVVLQEQPQGSTDEAGWTTIPSTLSSGTYSGASPGIPASFMTHVTLPAAALTQQFRLLVREYELFDATGAALPVYESATLLPSNALNDAQRVVYAETVDVTAYVNAAPPSVNAAPPVLMPWRKPERAE